MDARAISYGNGSYTEKKLERQPSSVRLFLACPTVAHGRDGYFAQTTTREPPVVSGLIPQDTV